VQRTLVILKPDAMHRRLVGRIIQRFEDKGLRPVAMKMMHITSELASRHYGEHRGKPFYEPLLKFITSAPAVVMVLEAPAAVDVVRRMVGPTFGAEAAAGTIRGDMAMSNRYNLVHASDGPASAEKEIALFFRREELCPWTPADTVWITELPWDDQ
jgi:nucleoside-diphosphate kinase